MNQTNQAVQTWPTPGSIVAINCGSFTHYALVSDTLGYDGFPKLIGASNRTRTVREESWTNIIAGQAYKVIDNPGHLSVYQVLSRARSAIDKWKYSVLDNNCEHFVNWASGLPKSSKQVAAGAGCGIALGGLAYAMSKNNRGWKSLVAAAIGAYLGVQAVK